MHQEQMKRTSYLAIGAFVCVLAAIGSGLLYCLSVVIGLDIGMLVVYAIRLPYLAAILSLAAIVMITVRRKLLKGYIYAVLALILSSPFMFIDYGFRCQAKIREQREREWTGLYNLEFLGKEIIRYARDNNGYLPEASRWCDQLMEYNPELSKENFMHPQHPKLPKENYKFTAPENFRDIFNFKGEVQFAFNKNLSGKHLADIPGDVVLIFEADGDWNLSGAEELLKTRYREKGYITILFVDQTTGDYWFYENAVRKFDPKGTQMYYEKPRWSP
jgi:hypothetical protein